MSLKIASKHKLTGIALLLLTSASAAEAALYEVSAVFADGGIQGKTVFTGSFDWDGSTISDFQGGLTQSMWAWDTTTNSYKSSGRLSRYTATGGGQPPVLDLTYQLGGQTAADADGDVTVSVFLLNDTNVFTGGGYKLGDSLKYGLGDNETPNENAYFTLAFNAFDPTNTATAMDKIVYGDATPYGLMGPLITGPLAMTGHSDTVTGYLGSMGGYPISLSITEVTAVPVPAALWLFASGLLGMGAFRKRTTTA